jgi:hypothetical protein
MTTTAPTGLALLRQPFPPNQISKLPKPKNKDAPKGHCNECGGWHGLPAVHLDYVGHAALTDRLLDADPTWTWEPLSMSTDGLPVLDGYGGMWIKLTVCGVTRLGYGDAGDKSGGNAIKEVIGDALRNAAMRFGAALELWHKGDLHGEHDREHAEKAVALRTQWLAAQFAAIDQAATVGEMKRVVEAAVAVAQGEKDDDAEAQIRERAAMKVAKAKPAKETA